ncbi:MAG: hypothetical protein R2744_01970 [Bacteroidales bacterium]
MKIIASASPSWCRSYAIMVRMTYSTLSEPSVNEPANAWEPEYGTGVQVYKNTSLLDQLNNISMPLLRMEFLPFTEFLFMADSHIASDFHRLL